MEQAYQWDLVHHFLNYKGVEITQGPSQSLVHLNEELDRKFMNRPFYWHYRDATNQPGEPMTISIVKDQINPLPANAVMATPLNPIFNQLVDAAHVETRWYKAYETVQAPTTNYAPLYPWIIIQGIITMDPPGSASYWKEAAISLTTGSIMTGDQLYDYEKLQPSLPHQHVTMTPVIQFERAIQKLLVELDQKGRELFKDDILKGEKLKDRMQPFLQQLKEREDQREFNYLSQLYEPKLKLNHPVGGIIYSQHI